MSVASDVSTLQAVVKRARTYITDAPGELDKLKSDIESHTYKDIPNIPEVDLNPTGAKKRRTSDQQTFLDHYQTMSSDLGKVTAAMKKLCDDVDKVIDRTDWVEAFGTDSTEWQGVASSLSQAYDDADPQKALKAYSSWTSDPPRASQQYVLNADSQRNALYRAESMATTLKNAADRIKGAGERLYSDLAKNLEGLKTYPHDISDAFSWNGNLPSSVHFKNALGYINGDASNYQSGFDQAVTSFETTFRSAFERVRSKANGGTGDPDDRESITKKLNGSWPKVSMK